VDAASCTVGIGALRSTYFANAYYSYQTCSPSTNSMETIGSGSADGLNELAGIVENYLRADARAVEEAYAATATSGYRECDAMESCPCRVCEAHPDWYCAADAVGLESGMVLFRASLGPFF
jgi:hypothetical protein